MECYKNKWHPTETQCLNEAEFKGVGCYNLTDDWTWCIEHRPPDEFSVKIEDNDDGPNNN